VACARQDEVREGQKEPSIVKNTLQTKISRTARAKKAAYSAAQLGPGLLLRCPDVLMVFQTAPEANSALTRR
jgi:hypothetical protein